MRIYLAERVTDATGSADAKKRHMFDSETRRPCQALVCVPITPAMMVVLLYVSDDDDDNDDDI